MSDGRWKYRRKRVLTVCDLAWVRDRRLSEVDWWPEYAALATVECAEGCGRFSEHVGVLHGQRLLHRMVALGAKAAA